MTVNLFNLNDKVVIVTGGLGQLGRQYACSLVEAGAKVAVFDIRADDLTLVQKWFGAVDDNKIAFYDVDISNKDSIQKALNGVVDRWGAPDGLINNAALDAPPNAPATETGPFESYSEESFEKVMDVNVKGTLLCCQVVGGAMAKKGAGSIVNISSIYGLVSPDQRIYAYRDKKDGKPFFKPVSYAVSKSALFNMTRYLAVYWADKNVRVNSLTLGGVFNNQDKEFLDGYCNRVPLNRMAKEDEYNGPIIFLVSDASSYMTGSNLVVDGGWTAW